MRIGIITCRDLGRFFPSEREPCFTHDDQVLVDALRIRGHEVEPVVWGAPVRDLLDRSYERLVMRSPWDYGDTPGARAAFTTWLSALDGAGLTLANPVPVMLWNIDKHYLGDLQRAGVPTVPTTFLAEDRPVTRARLAALLRETGPLVLKPCISAAACDTFRMECPDDPLTDRFGRSVEDLAGLCRGRGFMVQPFIPEIRTRGEWSLVFIDGHYSHCVLKRPPPGGWLVQDELGGTVEWCEPTPDMIRVADQAIGAVPEILTARGHHGCRPLYGRVDILLHKDQPLVGELELIEPELFFLQRPPAPPEVFQPAVEKFLTGIERPGVGWKI